MGWPKPSTQYLSGKAMLQSMGFDTLKYSAEDLVLFTLDIFNQIGVTDKFEVSETKLKRFILRARSSMRDNHYHNWAHAFDVVQMTYCLALRSGVLDKLSAVQQFALIVAALCHDLEHPGVGNQFLVNTRADLAIIYNDKSVLENHHAFRTFQLLNSESLNVLSELSKEDYTQFRGFVISCILSTDMARHAEYVGKLKGCLEEAEAREDLALAAKVLIKSADISNVTRPFAVAKRWANRITLELFLQGDRERALGLPVTPTCNRETQAPAALQRGFSAFVALPFFELVERYLPALDGLSVQIRANAQRWGDEAQPCE